MTAITIQSGMTIDGVTLLLGPNNNIQINTAIVPVILGSATGIDAKTVAGTLAYTNNTARTIIVYGYYALCTAATAITVGPTCSLGTSAGTSDITAAIPLVALLNATTANLFSESIIGISVAILPGGSVYFNVNAAATGTSQTLSAYILGYST